MARKEAKATRIGMPGVERVRTRRMWKTEEKPTITMEANEDSAVIEGCRRHSIDPSILTRLRESYCTFSLDSPDYRWLRGAIRR